MYIFLWKNPLIKCGTLVTMLIQPLSSHPKIPASAILSNFTPATQTSYDHLSMVKIHVVCTDWTFDLF